MTLGALVVLNIIDKNLQPAFHSAMIEIESEAPNFQGLPTTFMLTCVNPRIERLQKLVVSRE
jgi:hypothetical protein